MGILTRAIRNLSRRKARASIVIIVLTLALTLLIALPPSITERADLTENAIGVLGEWSGHAAASVTLSATEIQCEYGDNFGPDLIFSGESTIYFENLLMNQSLYQSIASIPDVNTVIPILEDLPTANRSYLLYGVPLRDSSYLKDPTILPSNITMGRNLQVGDSGDIVVDEMVAKNYNWAPATVEENVAALYAKDYVVHVGDSFEVLGRNFTVVGIVGYDPIVGFNGVAMSLEDAQSVTGKAGMASKYFIFVDDVDSVSPVVTRIQNLDPKLKISAGYFQLNTASEVLSQIDDVTNSAQKTLNSIQGTGTAQIALAVVVIIVVILFMMLFSVRERTKEIGTLKAMGAKNSQILGQFILEGMLLCLIAGVIAIVISVFVMTPVSNALLPMPAGKVPFLNCYPNGTLWFDYEFTGGYVSGDVAPASVTPELMLLTIGLALLLGVVGSLYPALKAARTKPAEAMRYE